MPEIYSADLDGISLQEISTSEDVYYLRADEIDTEILPSKVGSSRAVLDEPLDISILSFPAILESFSQQEIVYDDPVVLSFLELLIGRSVLDDTLSRDGLLDAVHRVIFDVFSTETQADMSLDKLALFESSLMVSSLDRFGYDLPLCLEVKDGITLFNQYDIQLQLMWADSDRVLFSFGDVSYLEKSMILDPKDPLYVWGDAEAIEPASIVFSQLHELLQFDAYDRAEMNDVLGELFPDGFSGLSEQDIIFMISQFVHGGSDFAYTRDRVDSWSRIARTLYSRQGDCEDLALVQYGLLVTALDQAGFSTQSFDIYAGLMSVSSLKLGHAMLVYTDLNGSQWILDFLPESDDFSSAFMAYDVFMSQYDFSPFFTLNSDETSVFVGTEQLQSFSTSAVWTPIDPVLEVGGGLLGVGGDLLGVGGELLSELTEPLGELGSELLGLIPYDYLFPTIPGAESLFGSLGLTGDVIQDVFSGKTYDPLSSFLTDVQTREYDEYHLLSPTLFVGFDTSVYPGISQSDVVQELIQRGYIDEVVEDGDTMYRITSDFRPYDTNFEFVLGSQFNGYEDDIFKILDKQRTLFMVTRDLFMSLPGVDWAQSVEIWEQVVATGVIDNYGFLVDGVDVSSITLTAPYQALQTDVIALITQQSLMKLGGQSEDGDLLTQSLIQLESQINRMMLSYTQSTSPFLDEVHSSYVSQHDHENSFFIELHYEQIFKDLQDFILLFQQIVRLVGLKFMLADSYARIGGMMAEDADSISSSVKQRKKILSSLTQIGSQFQDAFQTLNGVFIQSVETANFDRYRAAMNEIEDEYNSFDHRMVDFFRGDESRIAQQRMQFELAALFYDVTKKNRVSAQTAIIDLPNIASNLFQEAFVGITSSTTPTSVDIFNELQAKGYIDQQGQLLLAFENDPDLSAITDSQFLSLKPAIIDVLNRTKTSQLQSGFTSLSLTDFYKDYLAVGSGTTDDLPEVEFGFRIDPENYGLSYPDELPTLFKPMSTDDEARSGFVTMMSDVMGAAHRAFYNMSMLQRIYLFVNVARMDIFHSIAGSISGGYSANSRYFADAQLSVVENQLSLGTQRLSVIEGETKKLVSLWNEWNKYRINLIKVSDKLRTSLQTFSNWSGIFGAMLAFLPHPITQVIGSVLLVISMLTHLIGAYRTKLIEEEMDQLMDFDDPIMDETAYADMISKFSEEELSILTSNSGGNFNGFASNMGDTPSETVHALLDNTQSQFVPMAVADYQQAHLYIDPTDPEVLTVLQDDIFPDGISGLSADTIALRVHQFVSDRDQFSYREEEGDYWGSLSETLSTRQGDCEDFANLEVSLLKAALVIGGHDSVADSVVARAGEFLSSESSEGHVVVTYLSSSGQRVLDPTVSSTYTSVTQFPLLEQYILQTGFSTYFVYNEAVTTQFQSVEDDFSTSSLVGDLIEPFYVVGEGLVNILIELGEIVWEDIVVPIGEDVILPLGEGLFGISQDMLTMLVDLGIDLAEYTIVPIVELVFDIIEELLPGVFDILGELISDIFETPIAALHDGLALMMAEEDDPDSLHSAASVGSGLSSIFLEGIPSVVTAFALPIVKMISVPLEGIFSAMSGEHPNGSLFDPVQPVIEGFNDYVLEPAAEGFMAFSSAFFTYILPFGSVFTAFGNFVGLPMKDDSDNESAPMFAELQRQIESGTFNDASSSVGTYSHYYGGTDLPTYTDSEATSSESSSQSFDYVYNNAPLLQQREHQIMMSFYHMQNMPGSEFSGFLDVGADRVVMDPTQMAYLKDELRLTHERLRLSFHSVKIYVDHMLMLSANLTETSKKTMFSSVDSIYESQFSIMNQLVGLQEFVLGQIETAKKHNSTVQYTRVWEDIDFRVTAPMTSIGFGFPRLLPFFQAMSDVTAQIVNYFENPFAAYQLDFSNLPFNKADRYTEGLSVVQPSDFGSLVLGTDLTVDDIWSDLVSRGYVSSNGVIQAKFRYESFTLPFHYSSAQHTTSEGTLLSRIQHVLYARDYASLDLLRASFNSDLLDTGSSHLFFSGTGKAVDYDFFSQQQSLILSKNLRQTYDLMKKMSYVSWVSYLASQIKGGAVLENSMMVGLGLIEREMSRDLEELQLIQTFKQAQADALNEQFDLKKGLEKAIIEGIVIGVLLFAGVFFQVSNLVMYVYLFKQFGDLVHGFHHAFGLGSDNDVYTDDELQSQHSFIQERLVLFLGYRDILLDDLKKLKDFDGLTSEQRKTINGLIDYLTGLSDNISLVDSLQLLSFDDSIGVLLREIDIIDEGGVTETNMLENSRGLVTYGAQASEYQIRQHDQTFIDYGGSTFLGLNFRGVDWLHFSKGHLQIKALWFFWHYSIIATEKRSEAIQNIASELGQSTSSLSYLKIMKSAAKSSKRVQDSQQDLIQSKTSAHVSRHQAIQKERLETFMQMLTFVFMKLLLKFRSYVAKSLAKQGHRQDGTSLGQLSSGSVSRKATATSKFMDNTFAGRHFVRRPMRWSAAIVNYAVDQFSAIFRLIVNAVRSEELEKARSAEIRQRLRSVSSDSLLAAESAAERRLYGAMLSKGAHQLEEGVLQKIKSHQTEINVAIQNFINDVQTKIVQNMRHVVSENGSVLTNISHRTLVDSFSGSEEKRRHQLLESIKDITALFGQTEQPSALQAYFSGMYFHAKTIAHTLERPITMRYDSHALHTVEIPRMVLAYQRTFEGVINRTQKQLADVLNKRGDRRTLEEYDRARVLLMKEANNLHDLSASTSFSEAQDIYKAMTILQAMSTKLNELSMISTKVLTRAESRSWLREFLEKNSYQPWREMARPHRGTLSSLSGNFSHYVNSFSLSMLADGVQSPGSEDDRKRLMDHLQDMMKDEDQKKRLMASWAGQLAFFSRHSFEQGQKVSEFFQTLLDPTSFMKDLDDLEKQTFQDIGKHLLVAKPEFARQKMLLLMDTFRDPVSGTVNAQDLMTYLYDPDHGQGLYQVAKQYGHDILIKRMIHAFKPKRGLISSLSYDDRVITQLYRDFVFDDQVSTQFGQLYTLLDQIPNDSGRSISAGLWERLKWKASDWNTKQFSISDYEGRFNQVISSSIESMRLSTDSFSRKRQLRGAIQFYLSTYGIQKASFQKKLEELFKLAPSSDLQDVVNEIRADQEDPTSASYAALTHLVKQTRVTVGDGKGVLLIPSDPEVTAIKPNVVGGPMHTFSDLNRGVSSLTYTDNEASVATIQGIQSYMRSSTHYHLECIQAQFCCVQEATEGPEKQAALEALKKAFEKLFSSVHPVSMAQVMSSVDDGNRSGLHSELKDWMTQFLEKNSHFLEDKDGALTPPEMPGIVSEAQKSLPEEMADFVSDLWTALISDNFNDISVLKQQLSTIFNWQQSGLLPVKWHLDHAMDQLQSAKRVSNGADIARHFSVVISLLTRLHVPEIPGQGLFNDDPQTRQQALLLINQKFYSQDSSDVFIRSLYRVCSQAMDVVSVNSPSRLRDLQLSMYSPELLDELGIAPTDRRVQPVDEIGCLEAAITEGDLEGLGADFQPDEIQGIDYLRDLYQTDNTDLLSCSDALDYFSNAHPSAAERQVLLTYLLKGLSPGLSATLLHKLLIAQLAYTQHQVVITEAVFSDIIPEEDQRQNLMTFFTGNHIIDGDGHVLLIPTNVLPSLNDKREAIIAKFQPKVAIELDIFEYIFRVPDTDKQTQLLEQFIRLCDDNIQLFSENSLVYQDPVINKQILEMILKKYPEQNPLILQIMNREVPLLLLSAAGATSPLNQVVSTLSNDYQERIQTISKGLIDYRADPKKSTKHIDSAKQVIKEEQDKRDSFQTQQTDIANVSTVIDRLNTRGSASFLQMSSSDTDFVTCVESLESLVGYCGLVVVDFQSQFSILHAEESTGHAKWAVVCDVLRQLTDAWPGADRLGLQDTLKGFSVSSEDCLRRDLSRYTGSYRLEMLVEVPDLAARLMDLFSPSDLAQFVVKLHQKGAVPPKWMTLLVNDQYREGLNRVAFATQVALVLNVLSDITHAQEGPSHQMHVFKTYINGLPESPQKQLMAESLFPIPPNLSGLSTLNFPEDIRDHIIQLVVQDVLDHRPQDGLPLPVISQILFDGITVHSQPEVLLSRLSDSEKGQVLSVLCASLQDADPKIVSQARTVLVQSCQQDVSFLSTALQYVSDEPDVTQLFMTKNGQGVLKDIFSKHLLNHTDDVLGILSYMAPRLSSVSQDGTPSPFSCFVEVLPFNGLMQCRQKGNYAPLVEFLTAIGDDPSPVLMRWVRQFMVSDPDVFDHLLKKDPRSRVFKHVLDYVKRDLSLGGHPSLVSKQSLLSSLCSGTLSHLLKRAHSDKDKDPLFQSLFKQVLLDRPESVVSFLTGLNFLPDQRADILAQFDITDMDDVVYLKQLFSPKLTQIDDMVTIYKTLLSSQYSDQFKPFRDLFFKEMLLNNSHFLADHYDRFVNTCRFNGVDSTFQNSMMSTFSSLLSEPSSVETLRAVPDDILLKLMAQFTGLNSDLLRQQSTNKGSFIETSLQQWFVGHLDQPNRLEDMLAIFSACDEHGLFQPKSPEGLAVKQFQATLRVFSEGNPKDSFGVFKDSADFFLSRFVGSLDLSYLPVTKNAFDRLAQKVSDASTLLSKGSLSAVQHAHLSAFKSMMALRAVTIGLRLEGMGGSESENMKSLWSHVLFPPDKSVKLERLSLEEQIQSIEGEVQRYQEDIRRMGHHEFSGVLGGNASNLRHSFQHKLLLFSLSGVEQSFSKDLALLKRTQIESRRQEIFFKHDFSPNNDLNSNLMVLEVDFSKVFDKAEFKDSPFLEKFKEKLSAFSSFLSKVGEVDLHGGATDYRDFDRYLGALTDRLATFEEGDDFQGLSRVDRVSYYTCLATFYTTLHTQPQFQVSPRLMDAVLDLGGRLKSTLDDHFNHSLDGPDQSDALTKQLNTLLSCSMPFQSAVRESMRQAKIESLNVGHDIAILTAKVTTFVQEMMGDRSKSIVPTTGLLTQERDRFFTRLHAFVGGIPTQHHDVLKRLFLSSLDTHLKPGSHAPQLVRNLPKIRLVMSYFNIHADSPNPRLAEMMQGVSSDDFALTVLNYVNKQPMITEDTRFISSLSYICSSMVLPDLPDIRQFSFVNVADLKALGSEIYLQKMTKQPVDPVKQRRFLQLSTQRELETLYHTLGGRRYRLFSDSIIKHRPDLKPMVNAVHTYQQFRHNDEDFSDVHNAIQRIQASRDPQRTCLDMLLSEDMLPELKERLLTQLYTSHPTLFFKSLPALIEGLSDSQRPVVYKTILTLCSTGGTVSDEKLSAFISSMLQSQSHPEVFRVIRDFLSLGMPTVSAQSLMGVPGMTRKQVTRLIEHLKEIGVLGFSGKMTRPLKAGDLNKFKADRRALRKVFSQKWRLQCIENETGSNAFSSFSSRFVSLAHSQFSLLKPTAKLLDDLGGLETLSLQNPSFLVTADEKTQTFFTSLIRRSFYRNWYSRSLAKEGASVSDRYKSLPGTDHHHRSFSNWDQHLYVITDNLLRWSHDELDCFQSDKMSQDEGKLKEEKQLFEDRHKKVYGFLKTFLIEKDTGEGDKAHKLRLKNGYYKYLVMHYPEDLAHMICFVKQSDKKRGDMLFKGLILAINERLSFRRNRLEESEAQLNKARKQFLDTIVRLSKRKDDGSFLYEKHYNRVQRASCLTALRHMLLDPHVGKKSKSAPYLSSFDSLLLDRMNPSHRSRAEALDPADFLALIESLHDNLGDSRFQDMVNDKGYASLPMRLLRSSLPSECKEAIQFLDGMGSLEARVALMTPLHAMTSKVESLMSSVDRQLHRQGFDETDVKSCADAFNISFYRQLLASNCDTSRLTGVSDLLFPDKKYPNFSKHDKLLGKEETLTVKPLPDFGDRLLVDLREFKSQVSGVDDKSLFLGMLSRLNDIEKWGRTFEREQDVQELSAGVSTGGYTV